jgi:hypothetical protein
MDRCIIEAAVKLVSRKIKRSSHLCPRGKQQDIRKKPHVIDVALEQNIQHSYWYIMWMATCTMPIYEI